jgi:hypothetical protein
MARVVLGVLWVALLAPPNLAGAAPCGALAGDVQAVAVLGLDVTAACDCCTLGSVRAARRCAVPLVKHAVAEGRLPRRCGHPVVRDLTHACAVARRAGIPCRVCSGDAACEDGNPCTADSCKDGTCVHECQCVSPGTDGGLTCCPGPAAECPPPPTSSTTTTLPKTCDPGTCRYWRTCGYPVCPVPDDTPIPGVDPCTTQQEGAPCTTFSETCDPGVGCGMRLLCTDRDPAVVCPISRREAKTDIAYLDDTALDRMLAEIRRVRLATYRYKGETSRGANRLGFIIDDLGPSPAVAADGGHVDLYGYTSMAVAAIQAQQRRIDALEREIAALRDELARHR